MGPHERLERLYDDHGAAVLAYAERRAAPGRAEEVLSDTFLVAWRRLDVIPAGAERPWLLGVARRVLGNQRRGDRRRDALGRRLDAEARPGAAGDEGSDLDVRAALAALPERQREIVLLVFWDGLTPAEAAAALGTTGLAARSRLHRALRTLRAALADAGDGPPASLPLTASRETT